MSAAPVELTVVGSINLDFSLRLERLPLPGETVTAREFFRAAGGKGANQAVAAARLGAQVTMIGAVGADALAAATKADFFALNAAPARALDLEPDLLVVNELEHDVFSRGKLVAVTYGAKGAALFEGDREVARAKAPEVAVVDSTGAGDAFTAALVVSLLEGRDPQDALERAVAEGARATTRLGAQTWS